MTSTKRPKSRKADILDAAVRLFAVRGYHGVGIDDIGAAVGISGPAVYHHFASKDALLVDALLGCSMLLRDTGHQLAGGADGEPPADTLASMVDWHVGYCLDNQAMIVVQSHELDNLPDEARREIRRLQREYVEDFVRVLRAARSDLPEAEARVRAHAAFGLIQSTPYLPPELDRAAQARVLRAAAMRALIGADDLSNLTIVK
ncbi:MAG: TetR/AcrR family transcriptional regulator [Mycobacteriales bacterium]